MPAATTSVRCACARMRRRANRTGASRLTGKTLLLVAERSQRSAVRVVGAEKV